MISEIKDNELIIMSEDPMDAQYLEYLFADSVHITKESDRVPKGFHMTDERCVRIKFTKQETNDEKS